METENANSAMPGSENMVRNARFQERTLGNPGRRMAQYILEGNITNAPSTCNKRR